MSYDMGVAAGDYDNDGYEDLYTTGVGGNHLYHNNGNGTFTDVTQPSGTGVAVADYNSDGHVDIFVAQRLDGRIRLAMLDGFHGGQLFIRQ